MNGRVLVVDELVPTPDRDGGSLRMLNLLALLAELAGHVAFAACVRRPDDPALALPRVELVSETPEEHLRVHGADYDAVVLSRPDVGARLVGVARRFAPDALLVYDTPDLYFVREFRRAKLARSAALLDGALRRRQQELSLVRAADRTLVVSEPEREVLARECPDARVHVVSNVHPAPGAERPFAARRDALFLGNFEHEPNADAARFLLADLWPRVLARRPGLVLEVAGHAPPAWLVEARAPGVRVSGWLDDEALAARFEARRLSVAPLRFGAGVKGKVLASLGHGLPVVGTGVAFEGIPVRNGADAVLADGADELAAAIVRVHEDESLWARLSAAGPALVAGRFSAEAARAGLEAALEPVQVGV